MIKQVIVVTGANRGIGYEICRQLAALDLTVVLTSRQQKDGLEAVAKLNKNKSSVHYHQLDVTDPAQISKLKDFLIKEFGRCDGLVNNAGIMLKRKYVLFREALAYNRSIKQGKPMGEGAD